MSSNVLAAIEGAHASEVEDRTASRHLVRLMEGTRGDVAVRKGSGEAQGGVHKHGSLDRPGKSTSDDGQHSHVFLLPDGHVVRTAEDGNHSHALPSSGADSTKVDGKHTHSITLPDGAHKTGDGISSHGHELQLSHTVWDGLHQHTLTLPDGKVIRSMTPGQFFMHTAKATYRDESKPRAKSWTDVVADILPHGTRYLHPFLSDDWQAAVKAEDAPDVLFVMSQPDDIATASEVATSLALVKGSWLVECEDSEGARHSLARIGKAFKLEGSDSLFCASFPIEHTHIGWVNKAAVSKPFAGFPDFKACIAAAMERGASEEDARKICGALQALDEARRADRTKHLGHIPSESTLTILKREIPIYKTEDERFVMGIVLEPEPFDGKGDAQQDVYSSDEVRTAAHKFMEDFRNLGLMHQSFINGSVKILESFLAPDAFDMGGIAVKKGTWLMAIRVIEDNLWMDIKAGRLTGFSIGGTAVRRPA